DAQRCLGGGAIFWAGRQALNPPFLFATTAVIGPQPEMALDGLGLRGDGARARVYALLKKRQLLRFIGLIADVIINAGGAPQPLIIILIRGQRALDDVHRLFVPRGFFAKGEEFVGLLKRICTGRSRDLSRDLLGLRLREDG